MIVLIALIFFFNDTATTEIYTLSLHDALPICLWRFLRARSRHGGSARGGTSERDDVRASPRTASAPTRSASRSSTSDRKSTRLNSSHGYISYAVFCLKKKTIDHRAAWVAARVA